MSDSSGITGVIVSFSTHPEEQAWGMRVTQAERSSAHRPRASLKSFVAPSALEARADRSVHSNPGGVAQLAPSMVATPAMVQSSEA